MTKRYAVECDTPDGGRTTYPECWGRGARRGRVLSEHDTLAGAIQACDGRPATDLFGAVTPWIWDRRLGRIVSRQRIQIIQGEYLTAD